jgi:hypothetical protein
MKVNLGGQETRKNITIYGGQADRGGLKVADGEIV